MTSEVRRPRVPPPFRVVAIPAALALASIGGIAAQRSGLPAWLGMAAGAIAATLTVLALPSVPTRRATVVLLGIGGLGALRHAAVPGADDSLLLVAWALATLVALVLVDRADAETIAPMPGGAPLPRRGAETLRNTAVLAAIVVVCAVVLVAPLTDRLSRRVWPGLAAGPSDTASSSLKVNDELRLTDSPRLSDTIVFTVDAAHPALWRGETYDQFHQYYWDRSEDSSRSGPPLTRAGDTVNVAPSEDDLGASVGSELRQTYHFQGSFTNLVFAASSPVVVETDRTLCERGDGTLFVGVGRCDGDTAASPAPDLPGFGKNAVYTVTSRSVDASEDDLRAADRTPMPATVANRDARVPATTPRVRALARQITAGLLTEYDKVRAIEAWVGAHTRYSINAPPAAPGEDAVDTFLFRTRLGWCEQIASSMVVLARSAGIPARLATGYAPGDRDALTGRFVVRERDAHAWTEIYFPGIGWKDFDPTASVRLASTGGSSRSWLDAGRRHAVVLALVLGLVVAGAICWPSLAGGLRRRRARRASWSTRTLDRLERLGRRAGRARRPSETPREYAGALASHLDAPALEQVGAAIDADAFSRDGTSADERAAAEAVLSSTRP